MYTYVALLRGINVGGNTIVSMAQLKLSFEEYGFENVTTYINSGNVIFQSDNNDSEKLERQIEGIIKITFLLNIMILVRSFEQMDKLIKTIPKSWDGNKDYRYNVIFLAQQIDSPKILNSLNPKPYIEELHYRPGVLFWSAKTSDLTKTGMLKINKMQIYKQMTIRNINTTSKIYSIMADTEN